jgi:hypothetical protein
MAKETMLVIAFIATSERKWTLCDLWDFMKKKVFENLYVRRKDSLRDLVNKDITYGGIIRLEGVEMWTKLFLRQWKGRMYIEMY